MVASILHRAARRALAVCLPVVLAACSGAVGPAPTPPTPSALAITPSTATLFSGVPTTFVVTGGNGNYVITSDNQSVIPFIPTFSGNAVTIVPGDVAADTTVTITVRDTAGNTPASATLTVKARTLSNIVTVTPSSAACGSAVCAGGDAEVKVTLTQAGLPLANRTVQFDVVSGDYRIIAGSVGGVETLSLSGTTSTDTTGTARIRVRALDQATSQIAILQVTDVSSGATLRTSFTIAPSTRGALDAQPRSLRFTGRDADTCASNVGADVIVFGGRPPYSISSSAAFIVNPLVLGHSGDRFNVTSTGQCTSDTGSQIAVVDTAGSTVTVTAINQRGSATNVPDFVVSPTTVTLDRCDAVATVALAGGQGQNSYFAASGHSSVFANVSGAFGVIHRTIPSPGTTGPVTVTFSDGRTVKPVTVNLTGPAQGTCP